MKIRIAAVTALVMSAGWSTAHAGQVEFTPFASFHAEFGGATSATRPGFSLGLQQRVRGLPEPVQALRFSASPSALLAEVAGIPVATRQFRLNQDGDATAVEPAPEKHWYSRQWVWWTAAGVGTVAALGLAGASSGSENKTERRTNSDPPTAPANCITNVGETCLVPQPCVQEPPIGVDVCFESNRRNPALALRDVLAIQWLDEGTGQMGDLQPR